MRVHKFLYLAEERVRHFGQLLTKPIGFSLLDTMKVIHKFSKFVDLEENEEFIQDISKEEVLVVMKSLWKDCNSGPDGWTINFTWPS